MADAAPNQAPIDRSSCPAQRHGTTAARRHHGCTCPDATAAYRRYNRFQYAGKAHLCPDTDHRIDATGTRRRIQALYAIGHREDDLAQRLGYTSPQRVFAGQACVIPFMHNAKSQRRSRVFQSTAAKVAALYGELRDVPGPSKHLRERARRFGWFRPDEWDTADIDDPDSTPDVAGTRPRIVETNPADPWFGSLCRSGLYDPELWWAGTQQATEQAVRVCGHCPVRRHCLRHALTSPESYGVWGAVSERKRREVHGELRRRLNGRPMEGSPELDAVLDEYTPVPGVRAGGRGVSS
ncbi:WhiB family transcriptional regulator [Amycolatopsis sp. NPDC051903]|uniref:WhiB family transcriptional regulator n=1 Tax=Amycolatopsis sp. NPDC051903 TaxID=3363936 RepID=UPI0037B51A37